MINQFIKIFQHYVILFLSHREFRITDLLNVDLAGFFFIVLSWMTLNSSRYLAARYFANRQSHFYF